MPAKRIPARALVCARKRTHQFVHAPVCFNDRVRYAAFGACRRLAASRCVVYGTPADTHLRRGQRGIGFNAQESRSLEPNLHQLATVCAVLEGSNCRLRVQYALFDCDHRRFHLGVSKDFAGSSKP